MAYGTVIQDNQQTYYLIMDRLGRSLENYFSKHGMPSKQDILRIGSSVLEVLEKIHAAGYVYNDLKLDNILLNYGESSIQQLNLADLGFATRYRDKLEQHMAL